MLLHVLILVVLLIVSINPLFGKVLLRFQLINLLGELLDVFEIILVFDELQDFEFAIIVLFELLCDLRVVLHLSDLCFFLSGSVTHLLILSLNCVHVISLHLQFLIL